MVILDSTTKTIQILLSGLVVTSQLPIVASYADSELPAYASFADLRLSQETQATNQTITADTTVVTAVAAPGSGDQRRLKYLSVYNADTAEVTPTVRLNDNGTTRILAKPTLAVGDTLYYVEGIGFYVMDTNGAMKSAGTIPFATPSIVFGTAAAAGTGTSTIRSDATIVAFDTTVPVTQAFGDSAAAGSVAFASRRDHTHGMPATPVTTLAGTAAEITASAATGAVTLSLPTAITLTGKTATGGTFASPTLSGTVAGTYIFGGAPTITPTAGTGLAINLSTTGDFAVNTNQLYVDTSQLTVGINISAPEGVLHVAHPTSPAEMIVSGVGNSISGPSTRFYRSRGTLASQTTVATGDTIGSYFYFSHDGTALDTSAQILVNAVGTIATGRRPSIIAFLNSPDSVTNGAMTERMRIMETGNVKIAGTAIRATTEGTNHLDIFDGTAPVGTLANGISLYSTSGELRVMDSGGTPTLLSSHPRKLLNRLPITDRLLPWGFESSYPYLGKHLEVDIAGAIAEIEKLSGKQFIYISDLPGQLSDWDTDQEKLFQQRLVEQTTWDANISKQKSVRPIDYQKKRPPKWMVDRGVKTAILEV